MWFLQIGQGLNSLCTQWHKALCKTRRKPNHCRLLPLITGRLHLDIVLKRRFLNFLPLYCRVRTILYIDSHFLVVIADLHIYSNTGKGCIIIATVLTNDHVIQNLIMAWEDNLTDKNVRITSRIRELVHIRADLVSGFLSKSEYQSLIDFLSTV